MRNIFLLAFIIGVTAVCANAQSSPPRVEVFGGYSYYNADPIVGDNDHERRSANGAALSVAGNFNSKLGVVAEVSGHHGTLNVFGLDRDWNTYTFLFGPRFSVRADRFTGFAHVLVGGVKTNISQFERGTDFALAIGGGLDANINRRFAVRVVQLDYISARVASQRQWSGKFRAQTGIVFRW